MCGFYCIAFIEFMIVGRLLLDYTNLFSLNKIKKSSKKIYKYFVDNIWFKTQALNLDWKNKWNKKISFRRNKTQ